MTPLGAAQQARQRARLLEPLEPEGWRAVHGVSTGRGTIDTVLVGPGGLLTVEVKSHGGRIGRVAPSMLKQAYAHKRWLELITDRPVDALLVFSRASLAGRAVTQQEGVVVLPARMVPGHLQRREPRLQPAEVRELHQRLAYAFAAAA